jgi:hypothetical protein
MESGSNFRLIVRRGPQPNQVYELDKDFLTIGRDITNDIPINDPEVSRHHCRLIRGVGGYTMEDLGSTNGTFINGQRLTGARPLSSGDVIGLGETVTLSYEVVSMAPAKPKLPPGATPTVIGQTPGTDIEVRQPGGIAAPPIPVSPMSAAGVPIGERVPTPGYYTAPPPHEPPIHSYEVEPVSGGIGRFVFLGCGCFIVLCIISVIIFLIIIDSTNSWCDVPLVREFTEYMNEDILGTTSDRCPE